MRRRDLITIHDQDHRAQSFAKAILKLMGHIAGGAILFLTVAIAAWLLGVVVDQLNRLHPFPEKVLSIVHTAELWLLYADVLLSAIVVIFGIITFIRELSES
jgi:hypothetical protein